MGLEPTHDLSESQMTYSNLSTGAEFLRPRHSLGCYLLSFASIDIFTNGSIFFTPSSKFFDEK
jgi:hypothetical protein